MKPLVKVGFLLTVALAVTGSTINNTKVIEECKVIEKVAINSDQELLQLIKDYIKANDLDFVRNGRSKLNDFIESTAHIPIYLYLRNPYKKFGDLNVLPSTALTQSALESGVLVNSDLYKSNNYWGLKCGSSWDGNTTMQKDDDRDKNGKLIKSCFRTYNKQI